LREFLHYIFPHITSVVA